MNEYSFFLKMVVIHKTHPANILILEECFDLLLPTQLKPSPVGKGNVVEWVGTQSWHGLAWLECW